MSGTPRRYRRLSADAAEVRRRAHRSEGAMVSAAEDVIDQAREQEKAHAIPVSLSPSSMGTFTSCPLAFRFGYIERLPEPPSAPASKGTLVHLALQHLMWRPPEERTVEHALKDLARARTELEAHADLADLELTDEEWDQFHADAEVLVRRYFDIEDPRDVTVLGV